MRALAERDVEVAVLVLSVHDDASRLRSVLRAGARGCRLTNRRRTGCCRTGCCRTGCWPTGCWPTSRGFAGRYFTASSDASPSGRWLAARMDALAHTPGPPGGGANPADATPNPIHAVHDTTEHAPVRVTPAFLPLCSPADNPPASIGPGARRPRPA